MAALVAAGYVLAMMAGLSGQGLRLLGHLALHHQVAVLEAPALFPEATVYLLPGTTALRRSPGQASSPEHLGDRKRAVLAAHGSLWPQPTAASVAGEQTEVAGGEAPAAGAFADARPFQPLAYGAHDHGDGLHTHHAPEPAPALVLRTGVDQHSLPAPLSVPLAPVRSAPERAVWAGAATTTSPGVETPPPLARG